MTIGILCHGRHLQAVNWEALVWGIPQENKLGSLPRTVLEILNRGPENITRVVFGTGASEHDGALEAEAMKQFLLARMDLLEEFSSIRSHSRFQSVEDRRLVAEVVQNVFCEVRSQNTKEEIANAAAIFSEAHCTEIYQVSCGSHLPRCNLEMQKARKRGDIPSEQHWYGIADDMTFPGSEIEDVAVLEPPHRGDDPMLDASLQMHKIVPGLFKKSPQEKVRILRILEEELEK